MADQASESRRTSPAAADRVSKSRSGSAGSDETRVLVLQPDAELDAEGIRDGLLEEVGRDPGRVGRLDEGLLADGGELAVDPVQPDRAGEAEDRIVDSIDPQLAPAVVEAGADRLALDLLVVVVAPAGGEPHGLEAGEGGVELTMDVDPALLELGVDLGLLLLV